MSGNQREVPYEFDLLRNALAEEDPLASVAVDAAHALAHSEGDDDDDSDDSGVDSRSWAVMDSRRRRAEARIDAMEAEPSDSDEEADRTTTTTRQSRAEERARRRRDAADLARGGDRSTFADYFGDSDRRPVAPSGRGWEDTAGIAAGQRISEQTYGRSIDAIANTSLAEPEVDQARAAPPFSRTIRRQVQAARDEAYELRRDGRILALQIREERRRARRVVATHELEEALSQHRRSGADQRAEDELFRRAEAFAYNDSEAYDQWMDFCRLATKCTTSLSRRYQIIQWYTGGPQGSIHDPARRVPDNILRQVRRVELYHTRTALLEDELHRAQMADGSREQRRISEMQRDDDNAWAANDRREFLGFEGRRTLNGFSDYQARGEGAAFLRHLTANFYARDMRILHASEEEHAELVDRMESFANAALMRGIAVLRGLGDAPGPDFQDSIRGIEIAVGSYPTESHPYQGPIGSNPSSHGRVRGASDVDQIRDRLPRPPSRPASPANSSSQPPGPPPGFPVAPDNDSDVEDNRPNIDDMDD